MAPPMRALVGALGALVAFAQAQTIAITGSGPSNVQPRLEIRTLAQNADQWNLYLLAMADFKNVDQSNERGYYGISAVHGVPNQPYDGVTSAGGQDGYAVGWCPHNSNLFPGWHRAYVALFEQEFLTHVKSIASQFSGSDQARYTQAANAMRLPYWDWAEVPANGQPALPSTITGQSVTVNSPSGGQQTIPNPLAQYDMHPLDSQGLRWNPWNTWSTTKRYPSSNAPNAASNQQGAISAIGGENGPIRNRVYSLLSTCSDFRGFGNSDSAGTQYCGDSLEAIHNNIHNDMGGLATSSTAAGHMTILPLASFDPVFWLHHANVDRLWALWQGVYPNAFQMDATNPNPTYFYPAGSRGTLNTFLAPFHSTTSGGQHTTNTVRNWKTFGYDYPEFTSGDTSSAGIRSKVNQLYGPNARSPSQQNTPSSTQSQNNPQQTQQPQPQRSQQPGQQQPQRTTQNPQQIDWNSLINNWMNQIQERVRSQFGNGGSGGFGGGNGGNGGGRNGGGRGGPRLGKRTDLMDAISSLAAPYATDAPRPVSSLLAKIPQFLNSTMLNSTMLNSTMLNSTILNETTTALLKNLTSGSSGNFSSLLSNLNSTMSNHSAIEYTTQVACQPYAMNGSYNIYIFLGAPKSENPGSWSSDENLCGTYANLAAPGMYHNSTQTGAIPLTSAVAKQVQAGIIPSLDKEHVIPHLKDNIQWRVQNLQGSNVPPHQVPGLQIGVGSANVQPPKSPDEFPQITSPWKQHTDVTQDKAGGLKPGDKSPFQQAPGTNSTYWGPSSPSSASSSSESASVPASTAAPPKYAPSTPAQAAAPVSPASAQSPASPASPNAPAGYSGASYPSSAASNSSASPTPDIKYNPGSAAPVHSASGVVAAVLAGLTAALLL